MVDASERLQVLLDQEATKYVTKDYISRMQQCVISMDADAPVPSDDTDDFSPESPSKKRKSPLSSPDDYSTNRESTQGQAAPGESSADGSSAQINKHWREKICEWAYQGKLEAPKAGAVASLCNSGSHMISCLLSSDPNLSVVDHFDLHREVVSIAMSHLDRYLAVYPSAVDKNLFQLLAMTCLYLSVKLNEYKHLLIPGSKSSMDTILQLSRGFFTLEEMEMMEYDVLQRLQWHVHPPTPQLFVKHFLFFLSIEQHEVHDLSQFMVELSVMDYFFVSYKPSEIAIAGILNAIQRLLPDHANQSSFPFHRTMVDINTPEVLACRERLELIFAQANDQAGNDVMNDVHKTNRTTSPVSVMAAPQPDHYPADSMDAEYSEDEDL